MIRPIPPAKAGLQMTYDRSDHPEIHEMIGQRYVIVRQLREEPWGGVWLAQDNLLRTEVGLKLLARDAPEWAEARDMFEHAAILGLKLRHPQILGVFHVDKAEKFLYLVEEPFPGESLMAQWVRQERFSLAQALHLLELLGQALAFAHQQGEVHQCLSPLNILIQGEDLRLANFAFAPAYGDEPQHLELRAYAPPEVIHGDRLTPAGNVFSLGVLGFRLVAGSLPYPLTFDEPFPYRLEYPPADLEEIPVPLQNVLLRCLSEDPEERLPHAGALVSQLRQARELMHGVDEERGGLAAEKIPARLAAPGSGGAALEKGLGAEPAPGPKGQGCGPDPLKQPQAAAPAAAVGRGPGRPDGGPDHLRGQSGPPAGAGASTHSGGRAGGARRRRRRGAAPGGDRRGRGPRGAGPRGQAGRRVRARPRARLRWRRRLKTSAISWWWPPMPP